MTAKVLIRRVLKGASVFAVLALAIILLQTVEPTSDAYELFVDEHIRAHGLTGILLYTGLTALLASMCIPRQLLSFVGGYAFGAIGGMVLATLGVTLSCLMTFFYARFMGQRFIQKHLGKRIAWMEKFLSRSPFTMTIVIRLLPVGSNFLTNVVAGVTHIPAAPFVLGSCVGYLPQNFIFSLLGSGVGVDPVWRTALSAVLFLAAVALGVWLYMRYKKDMDEREEAENADE